MSKAWVLSLALELVDFNIPFVLKEESETSESAEKLMDDDGSDDLYADIKEEEEVVLIESDPETDTPEEEKVIIGLFWVFLKWSLKLTKLFRGYQ